MAERQMYILLSIVYVDNKQNQLKK